MTPEEIKQYVLENHNLIAALVPFTQYAEDDSYFSLYVNALNEKEVYVEIHPYLDSGVDANLAGKYIDEFYQIESKKELNVKIASWGCFVNEDNQKKAKLYFKFKILDSEKFLTYQENKYIAYNLNPDDVTELNEDEFSSVLDEFYEGY